MILDDTYYNSITEQVIGCAYQVANCLGPGFLEKVYENALCHELGKTDLEISQQQLIRVIYDDIVVGDVLSSFLACPSLTIWFYFACLRLFSFPMITPFAPIVPGTSLKLL